MISEDGTTTDLLLMLVHDDVVNANEEVVANAATTNKSKAATAPLLLIIFLLLLLSIMYDGKNFVYNTDATEIGVGYREFSFSEHCKKFSGWKRSDLLGSKKIRRSSFMYL